MLMHFGCQSDDQSSSNAKPFQQLWTSAACSAVRVAHDLVDQISEATNQDTRAIDRAGGIVLGWHERVLVDLNPKIRKHVRRFRRLDPFW